MIAAMKEKKLTGFRTYPDLKNRFDAALEALAGSRDIFEPPTAGPFLEWVIAWYTALPVESQKTWAREFRRAYREWIDRSEQEAAGNPTGENSGIEGNRDSVVTRIPLGRDVERPSHGNDKAAKRGHQPKR